MSGQPRTQTRRAESSSPDTDSQSDAPRVPRVPRYVEANVRRRLVERDGERCTWTDERGRRCDETRFLQIDHITPHCLRGQRDLSNLRLLCAAHNALEARRRLGPAAGARSPI